MARIAGLMKKLRGEKGFTIVELLMVSIVGSVLLAGMVGLLASIFGVFDSSKDVQTLNDSSRRALASVSNLLKPALHFDKTATDANQVTFWADIDNDQIPVPASTSTWADILRYKLTEKVRIYKDGTRLMMVVTQPASEGGTVSTARLGSYLTDLKFFYFQSGVLPGGTDPYNPTGGIPDGGDISGQVSMIRIVLKMSKGKIHRSYYQDVFLRIIQRGADY
jgi:competence protein ComGC